MNRSFSILAIFAAVAYAGVVVNANQPTPLSGQFQVNTFTTGNQLSPAVASDSEGNFVVVWDGLGDSSDYSIRSRRFSSDPNIPGSMEMQLNSGTLNRQTLADVSRSPCGDFVVAWTSASSAQGDNQGYSVQARGFDSSGVAKGNEMQLNTYTPDNQIRPSIAIDASGGSFVAAWESYGQDGDGLGVYTVFEGFPPVGMVGNSSPVNQHTTSNQSQPAVAISPTGTVFIAWQSQGQDGAGHEIYGRYFNSIGQPMANEFRVNFFTKGNQENPAVCATAGGDFIVAWDSNHAGSRGIFGRSNPTKTFGIEFQVKQSTFYQTRAALGCRPAPCKEAYGQDKGVETQEFVIAWESFPADGSDTAIFARRLSTDGTTFGDEFQVNSYTTGAQRVPAVASGREGTFVVTWTSDGSSGTDNDAYSIQGQRFSVTVIHMDGFESGDTSGWSTSRP